MSFSGWDNLRTTYLEGPSEVNISFIPSSRGLMEASINLDEFLDSEPEVSNAAGAEIDGVEAMGGAVTFSVLEILTEAEGREKLTTMSPFSFVHVQFSRPLLSKTTQAVP